MRDGARVGDAERIARIRKSHLAQALAAELGEVIVSVDPIEDATIESGLPMSFETGVAACQVAATVASTQLRNGLTVITDAANRLEVARDIWRRGADEAGVALHAIEVPCSDTDLHRSRLEGCRRSPPCRSRAVLARRRPSGLGGRSVDDPEARRRQRRRSG